MLIPVGDMNPVRRTPWITRLLLVGTIAVFFFVQPWTGDACTQLAFYVEWAAIPAELTQGAPLDPDQLATGPLGGCPVEAHPDKSLPLSIFASLMLHADPWHLGFNMLFLWIFGNNIEDRFGHLRYLGLYAVWGLVATVVFVGANPDAVIPLIGASGAIAGVLGSYVVLYPGARVSVVVLPLFFLTLQLPALIVLGLWFVVELWRSMETEGAGGGGVAYLAHVAGFAAGSLTALWARLRDRRRRPRRRRRHRR